MVSQCVTRQHLKGLGLSAYQARIISMPCPVQGKAQGHNLYAIADIRQAARDYSRKLRIRVSTRLALEGLIQKLSGLTDKVVFLPFGARPSAIEQLTKELIQSKDNTHPYKLRAAALKGTSTHV